MKKIDGGQMVYIDKELGWRMGGTTLGYPPLYYVGYEMELVYLSGGRRGYAYQKGAGMSIEMKTVSLTYQKWHTRYGTCKHIRVLNIGRWDMEFLYPPIWNLYTR